MNFDIVTIVKIVNILGGIAEMVAKYGPDFIQGVIHIIQDLKLAFKSATSGAPLSTDEQAQVDDALARGEKVLADAMTKADAEDAALTANT